MRRIDVLIGLLILLVVGGVLWGVKFFGDPDRKLIRNEDAEVIDAALLSFYKKADWQSPDWQQGDFIVVDPKCESRPYQTFVGELTDTLSLSRENPSNRRYWPILSDLLKRHSLTKTSPARKLDLRSLRFDSRIVIHESLSSMDGKRTPFRSRHGQVGNQRVGVHLNPPLYSQDGQVAIVTAGAGWLMHAADIFFCTSEGRGTLEARYRANTFLSLTTWS